MSGSVLIAGAGCAGLSLALRLRRHAPNVPLVLIDQAHGGHPHKLWSFWSTHPEAVLPVPVPLHSWGRLRAAAPGWARTSELGELRYCTVRSEAFEAAALAALRADAGVTIRTGRVRAVRSSGSSAEVVLDEEVLRGSYAFQSCLVPGGPAPRYPVWQHFGGVVVRTRGRFFDDSCVTLMDFDVPQQAGPTFLYELPFRGDEALVEHTVFSAERMAPAAHRAALALALEARGVPVERVVREEWGAIPMFERRPSQRRGPRAFNVGVVGGMAKPTTGYAFLRIQQQTEHFARTLAAGRPTPLPDPPWRLRAYDTALLDLIHRAPAQATAALTSLLRTTEGAAVLRFLDERPSVRDELGIIFGSLPWWPLIQSAPAALRHTPRWIRDTPKALEPAGARAVEAA
jgi:lycopene beta-cyclase